MTTSHFDQVRLMDEGDLKLVLSWRNHTDVRRYMYTSHQITLKEHSQWFERASRDPNRHLVIFEGDATPLGFINLHVAAPSGVADWGFYAAPDAPKGTGQRLAATLFDYAFRELGLHKLCGQAIAYNTRSIAFHQRLGFQTEGTLRDQYFDGSCYHDVLCFGLLASEWKTNK